MKTGVRESFASRIPLEIEATGTVIVNDHPFAASAYSPEIVGNSKRLAYLLEMDRDQYVRNTRGIVVRHYGYVLLWLALIFATLIIIN